MIIGQMDMQSLTFIQTSKLASGQLQLNFGNTCWTPVHPCSPRVASFYSGCRISGQTLQGCFHGLQCYVLWDLMERKAHETRSTPSQKSDPCDRHRLKQVNVKEKKLRHKCSTNYSKVTKKSLLLTQLSDCSWIQRQIWAQNICVHKLFDNSTDANLTKVQFELKKCS